jgi:hypothetical protein
MSTVKDRPLFRVTVTGGPDSYIGKLGYYDAESHSVVFAMKDTTEFDQETVVTRENRNVGYRRFVPASMLQFYYTERQDEA